MEVGLDSQGLGEVEIGETVDRKPFWKAMDFEPEQWGWWRSGVFRQPHKNVSLGEVRTIDAHLGVIQSVKVEMAGLVNSQRVKDIYKGLRKDIIEKGEEEINKPDKDQPGKRIIRAEGMGTKKRKF